MKFSIIVGYRNREINRVRYSLESLLKQTFSDFEVILVDYGSDSVHQNNLNQLVGSYQFVHYTHCHTQGWFWNRGHALNIGAREANGEILLFFDIDLILEPTFIEKISNLDYQYNYYTFSCYYLPEKFNYATDIIKNGIHYEQNYVGLCALKKSAFLNSGGFDEYYMIWGVEDDDLYMRLSKSGLQRHEMTAIEYKVFHQWHIKESPIYPSNWYLEMVDYYSNKKFNDISGVKKIDINLPLQLRPLLNERKSIQYHLRIEINCFSGFFVYNELIDGIHDPAIRSIYFYYNCERSSNARKKGFTNIYFWKQDKKIDSELISQKDVELFIQFIIGKNRSYIFDYFIENNQNEIQLYILKK